MNRYCTGFAGIAWAIAAAAAQVTPRTSDARESAGAGHEPRSFVELRIQERTGAGEDAVAPSRVHLKDSTGNPVRIAGFPAWNDHFVCDGDIRFELAPGDYTFEIERGPEYTRAQGGFVLTDTKPTQRLDVMLERIADLASEGWWSGDLHVHRDLKDAELLMAAEDLHIAQLTTWWNQSNPWQNDPMPAVRPVRFDGNRFYDPLAGEDERDGGAILYFNLARPLQISRATRHHPSSIVFTREARLQPQAWLELEKPFWWDFPLWLAQGTGDSVGIAQNHLQRSGVLDNEAWGRPRDRSHFPGPLGNGLYTQELYFHALNCGFRIPPSAGSASGVLPNPVGYNRVYVRVDGDLTWDKWWAGLRAGRVFVSNGPLLRARANGQWPGHVFQSPGPLHIQLDAQLDSREPIQTIELVSNGRVERITLPRLITLDESGWFIVRATADVTNTFRFAMTAPWYVEIGNRSRPLGNRSAQFFLDWSRERISTLDRASELNATQRAEVLQPWREAEEFWRNKVGLSIEDL